MIKEWLLRLRNRVLFEHEQQSYVIKECDVKKGIAEMYSMIGRACQRQAEEIENDIDSYVIDELKMGCELVIDNGKTYQLICELNYIKPSLFEKIFKK